ncbi:MAG TPA: S41 family peptidase [Gemmataceae bacterium]|jgi:tricorn protease|nr:S41 family peptidase [Gemmataceae bacterium]
MFSIRTYLASAVTALLLLCSARAQEPIRFGRTPDISPDGRLVAFSYLGDIWTVETIGGIARPVTMHEAHDIDPIFSPDGRYIAFSSNRHGSYDVFVVPAVGGKPKRLTFDSADDIVSGWSPDGKHVLFTSTRSTDYPSRSEVYSVPVTGGREHRITAAEGKDGVYSPKGDQIAYVRGPGTWYRKGYRGSSNDDIWVCNADGSGSFRVTNFNGQDQSPMWCPDCKALYYVSEVFGTPANIVRAPVKADPKAKPEQVTFHKDDGVRRARISANGEWIVYECGPDLWVVSTRDGTPRKLAIEVHADDKVNTERTITFTQGASEFALSADERNVAFVVHGEIFMMPIAGGKATRLTDSPANDHGIAWAPDSKKIIFASDRNGYEDLYLLEPDDPEHSELTKAHHFKIKQLTHTPEAEVGAGFSPDGKIVAFIRAGKLMTMKPDGSDQKVLVDEAEVSDYEWSPDSKYICYSRRDGYFASELYIVPAAGGEAKNITRFATYNAGVSWSHRGKKLAFISERRRDEHGVCVLPLQRPAAASAPSSSEIDWEDIHLRAEQPVQLPAEEVAISPDGAKIAFTGVTVSNDGRENRDLWVASTDGSHLTRLTSGNQRPRGITWLRYTPDTICFRDGSGSIRKTHASGPSPLDFLRTASAALDSGKIPFSARMMVRRDDLFHEMFEQSWRALSEEFYDPKYHGTDWSAVRVKYRPLVNHVALREDFYSLVSLMLGELNASHLGIAGYRMPPEETSADLGLIYDQEYRGPGLKVKEIVKRGPADKRGLGLKPGDIITAIDGAELKDDVNLSKLLNAKVGEPVMLTLQNIPAATSLAAGKTPPTKEKPRRVEITAIARDKMHDLMYDRWVENNAKRVAQLSVGRLGYIHIPSMDEQGLDRFVRALYSDNFDKDALVLDVRYNSGGFTHDQVLSYLGGQEHTVFRHRDGGQGMVMRSFDRKWTKPLVLLINNRSYSDAEIFPNAFRTLGLGKLVGQPTGAHVIGTYEVRLIDGSVFRIPRIGVYTAANVNMEKQGVLPDVLVDQLPEDVSRGLDPQLDKAVDVLKGDVIAWKKTHSSLALKTADAKTPAAVPTSSGK